MAYNNNHVYGMIAQNRENALTIGTTTSDVPEGSNLYFTSTRARSVLSANYPVTYNSSTGVIGFDTVFTDMDAPLGFLRNNQSTMGIIELSPDGTNILRIDNNGVFSSNSSGNFADGTAYQTAASARTFAIYPSAGGNITFYCGSKKYVKTTLQQTTLVNTTGLQYLWFDNTGTLISTTSFDPTKAFIATVYGNSTTQQKIVFADERHGIQMDVGTHSYLHATQGTKWQSGGAITGMTNGGTTYTNIGSGVFWDEDIMMNLPTQTNAPFWYIDGSEWTVLPDGVDIAYKPTTNAKYNLNTAGVWSLADVPNLTNDYMLIHFFATNDAQFPYVKILGQQYYGTSVLAQDAAPTEIYNLQLLGLPSAEFKPIGTVIVKGNGTLTLTSLGELYVDTRRLVR